MKKDVVWGPLLAGTGIGATIAGLVRTSEGELAFSLQGALSGIASQLPRTAPAAAAIFVAASANIAPAALLIRVVRGRAYRSRSDVLLHGFAGAVLFDTVLLFALGSIGWFSAPVLLIVHVAGLVAGLRWGRPVVVTEADGSCRQRLPWLWILVCLVWSAPIVLQLSSPVVPGTDVLPNHVAPVEHVRTFGSFAMLTTVPAPIYGPSRSFLGYIASLGTLSTMTRVEAHLAVGAFASPLVVLTILAMRRLARIVGGDRAVTWILLTFSMTVPFLRLSDLRSSVVALPLAATAVVVALKPEPGDRILLATPLAAALMVHPLIGGLAVITVLVVLLARDGEGSRSAGGAIVAALVASSPQGLTTLGIDAPSWTGLIALPVAVTAAWAVPKIRVDLSGRRLRRVAVAIAILATGGTALRFAPRLALGMADTVGELLRFPLLSLAAASALALAERRARRMLATGLGIALSVAVVVRVLPTGSRFFDSARSEALAKVMEFWVPTLLALAAATALAAWWGRERSFTPSLLVIAFVVIAAFPFGPRDIDTDPVEETRYAESLAIALHHADDGYWGRYPDPRALVDRRRRELIDAIRAEQEAGRLMASSQVLHVVPTFQQWSATPLAVFTGVIETVASQDPERSGHTIGGRLFELDDLETLLQRGYDYVVIEGDVPPGVRRRIARSALEEIFDNGHASLLARR